jgi:ABC-type nitrate/sulfonate/bicarbonate transport system permease component
VTQEARVAAEATAAEAASPSAGAGDRLAGGDGVRARLLQARKRERNLQIVGLIVPVAVLIGLWQLFAHLNESQAWVFPPLFPSPVDVFQAGREEWRLGFLQEDIPASLVRVLLGFLLAAVLGVLFGVLTGSVKPAFWTVHPILEFLRPVPPLALLPMFLLWFGIGEMSKIVFTAVVAFFPIYLNTFDAVQHVDPNLIRAAGSLGASRRQTFWHVILPAAAPGTFVGLRLGYAISWFALVATELIAATSGLGYRIMESRLFTRVDRMILGAILIGFIGYVTALVFVVIERRFFAYRRKAAESRV